jgi:hypothetical protein
VSGTVTGDNLILTLTDGSTVTIDVAALTGDVSITSGTVTGDDLILTKSDATTVTIDASNMVNGGLVTLVNPNWFIQLGTGAGTLVSANGNVQGNDKALFYHGLSLSPGQEFLWSHNVSTGAEQIGIWGGSTNVANKSNQSSFWLRSVNLADVVVRPVNYTANSLYGSVGFDIDTLYSAGYTLATGTVLALRYGVSDNKLALYDVTNDTLITKAVIAEDGNPVTISVGSQSDVPFPGWTRREDTWNIVADFDNSESGDWRDGIEKQTIIKSNDALTPGEKWSFNFPSSGNNRWYGLGYTGAATGEANVTFDPVLTSSFRWHTTETLQHAGDTWTYNTANSLYDSVTYNAWHPVVDGNAHPVELRYNTDGTLTYWDVNTDELIMTHNANMSGADVYMTYGAKSYVSSFAQIPVLVKSSITSVTFLAGTSTVSASDPTTTSNPSSLGHLWVNSTSGDTFICTDVTTNANVWVNGNTDNDTVYTHPTGDGNLHVPATSTSNSGKVLTAGSTAGDLSWLDVVGATSMGGTMTAGIIPDTDNVYDIGSAEYKIRDLYVSENSLWIGDNHKMTTSGGKYRNKKRKKGKTPKKVFDALIGAGKPFATEADLKVKFKVDIHAPAPSNTVDPDHADFQPLTHQWLNFAIINGMSGAITPENIFDNDEDFDDESTTTVSASDPLVTSNPTAVGHMWINSTTGNCYICTNITIGANQWTNIGIGTGNIP